MFEVTVAQRFCAIRVPHFGKHWAETFAWGELSGETRKQREHGGFLDLDSCVHVWHFFGVAPCAQEFTFIEGTEDWTWCGAQESSACRF